MFCEKCGAKLLSDAAFCEECGAPVEAAVTSPPHVRIPTYSQTTPQQKNSLKIGTIIAIAFFALAAVAVLLFTGFIGGEKPEAPDTPPAQAVQSDETPKLKATLESSSAEDQRPDNDTFKPSEESTQLSTAETPTSEDFLWFTDKSERWVYGITPAEAYMLEDFYALLGSWKGLQMIYDYDGTVLGYGYFTATFDESGPNVAATLDWHCIDWSDGSHEELTERMVESMTGSFAPPTLTLGEVGNRIQLILYAMDGKQYAEGIWTVQSGEEVRMALVRP